MSSQQHNKHKARKRFGQNFLQDQGIIRHIVASIRPQANQGLVEIGPGLGAITKHLLAAAGALDVVELDRDLIPRLRISFATYGDNLRIYEADALKFDFTQINDQPNSLRIVGNLPYNISTPLIFHLLEHAEQVLDMHFMLQKEVVQRLAAQAGENNYGRLSIMAQYYCQVENLFEVPPEAFDPRPKVDSAIVRLVPYNDLPHVADNHKNFSNLVRTAFAQRRKTLRNNLKGVLTAEQLEEIGIDATLRPERLTVADYVKISNYHHQHTQQEGN
ncbi:MAG TPA: 16S rRNA (adenine(1518)-N(6)/adenine(1519)-N(6))-dimethyltransferase [Oceanospirillaceae bacterium]|nr:16S rRNA (adenine(1518)-N(6)/adenine(1519)-N(6))-dimethyltransferase [Oceanospirillaceae bacterium]